MPFSLYDSRILPKEFRYPDKLITISQSQERLEMDGWWFIDAQSEYAKLAYDCREKERMNLVPFARLFDWAAYFDGNDKTGNPPVYVFDLGDMPHYVKFNDFNHWIKESNSFNR